MTLIDSVRKLQQQGMEDKEIAKVLREKGFSPKEVIDALSQSKIKAAVEGNPYPAQAQYAPQEGQTQQYPQYSNYPQNQDTQQYPQYPQQDFSQQYQQGYAYPQAPQYPQETTDSLKEIAEETAEEKVAELREKISSLSQDKKENDSKVGDMERRLKQLENSFTQLQSAILGKISDYSKELRSMTDEMHATQETFKKVLNPVVDRVKEKAEKKSKKK